MHGFVINSVSQLLVLMFIRFELKVFLITVLGPITHYSEEEKKQVDACAFTAMSSSLTERLIMKRQLFLDIAHCLFSDVAPSVPVLGTSVLQSDGNE